MNEMVRCELCSRAVTDYTVHHLVPKSRDGGKQPRALLCKACHRMVHRLFTNKELAEHYNSILKLMAHPEIKKFVRWVNRQDPHKRIKVH
ncbi:MAG: HNH endonuclease [Calditrichia bacterium]